MNPTRSPRTKTLHTTTATTPTTCPWQYPAQKNGGNEMGEGIDAILKNSKTGIDQVCVVGQEPRSHSLAQTDYRRAPISLSSEHENRHPIAAERNKRPPWPWGDRASSPCPPLRPAWPCSSSAPPSFPASEGGGPGASCSPTTRSSRTARAAAPAPTTRSRAMTPAC